MVSESMIAEIKKNLQRFQSDQPVASVVIIAHNEENRVLACLWSLSENQCDFPVEIMGIDNCSTDRTSQVFEMVGVPCYSEEKKGPGYARACGLAHAKGKYYFSIDADTIYPPTYLQTIIQALNRKGVVAVSSSYRFLTKSHLSSFKLRVYEFLRNIHFKALSFNSPELIARGAVFAYITEYGRKVGYRTHILAGEDGALALGLKSFGKIKFIFSRKARAITCSFALEEESSLWKNFTKRFKREIKHFKRYLFKQETYEDKEYNILPPSSGHIQE